MYTSLSNEFRTKEFERRPNRRRVPGRADVIRHLISPYQMRESASISECQLFGSVLYPGELLFSDTHSARVSIWVFLSPTTIPNAGVERADWKHRTSKHYTAATEWSWTRQLNTMGLDGEHAMHVWFSLAHSTSSAVPRWTGSYIPPASTSHEFQAHLPLSTLAVA